MSDVTSRGDRFVPLPGSRQAISITFIVVVALPTLTAFNLPPSSTFFNQAIAIIGWGGLLAGLLAPLRHAPGATSDPRAQPLFGALLLLALAASVAPLHAALPWSLALSSIGFVGAALLAASGGALLAGEGRMKPLFGAICIALVVAGALNSIVGVVQVFAPAWADGDWIARSAQFGRAAGNVRQPNHLSSLLLWCVVATVWLLDAGRLRRAVAALLVALFVFAMVLSASRTGTLGIVLLALWGLLDRRLSGAARAVLLAGPLFYVACWLGVAAWAQETQHVFVGDERLAQADLSSSRFAIWSNTLSLIAAHPWLGVGFGEFNFAWTLTPFADRPVAFFDHTHNLPLQFAVELGLPLATLMVGLLSWAFWRAFRIGFSEEGPAGPALRAGFMMLLLMAVHSLLEYPLWYAYFLLPTAFVFGLCLGGGGSAATATNQRAARRPTLLLIGAVLMVLGGLYSIVDYLRVAVIFAPPDNAAPLAQRIEAGQRSLFFAHHADYAAATTATHPSDAMSAFERAPHYLLDARLMMAWARALNERGDRERASYIAARLREFRNPQAEAFFAECERPRPPDVAPPFQCVAPTRAFTFRDFP